VHLFFIRRQKRSREKKTENDLFQSQLEIQEQTFNKISTEIHDNISLTLSLSKIYLRDLDFTDHADMSDKINISITLIKKAIDDLNDLSKSLNSGSIEKFGLVRSVEELINDISKAELFKVKFIVKGIPRVADVNTDLIIFRIVQEALNNIIRHANATHVSLKMEFEKTSLTVCIRDNGTGFSTEDVRFTSNGSGLANMKKRAQVINARLLVESKLHNGTAVKIILPLN
jgi:signal transduction histidine kinase